jgi:hypothetical protein
MSCDATSDLIVYIMVQCPDDARDYKFHIISQSIMYCMNVAYS